MSPLLVGLAMGALQLACFATDAAAAALPKDPCALLKPAEIQTLAPNAKMGSAQAYLKAKGVHLSASTAIC